MLPFDFTATPVTSPRYRSFGNFSGSDASNGICGTASCANAGDASSTNNPTSRHFMRSSFLRGFFEAVRRRLRHESIAADAVARDNTLLTPSIGTAILAKVLRPAAAEAIVHAQGVDPPRGRRGSAPLRGLGSVGEIRAARDRQSDQDDACAHGSHLLPLRLPPTDSITRVTLLTRPSLPKETTRISGENPSGLKRHSQVSLAFISYTSPGRPSRFLVSSRVVFA